MKCRIYVVVFLFTTFLMGSLSIIQASNQGKIAGRVVDKKTGQPLIGANVIVANENIGAATDQNGHYVILNVPPGKYNVSASNIGYKMLTIENVQVASDQTTTLNFEMESSAIQGEQVVVLAKKPLVQADLTSSRAVVTEDDIKEMPTENFQDMLSTKAGVTEGSNGELHIRGGRSSEILYMVDGIPVSNPFNNQLGLSVSNNMISELSMVSGTFNAEYGKAMSGVVNIVTREGGKSYKGELSAQSGDMYSNKTDKFPYVNQFDPLSSKRVDFSLSGPIPIVPKTTFFVSGTWKNSKGWLFGKREHTTYDSYNFNDPNNWQIMMTGDGKKVPMNPHRSINAMGKITTHLWKLGKLTYQFTGANNHWQNYVQAWKYNPDGRYHHESSNALNALHFSHTISDKSYFTIKAAIKTEQAADYVHKLPIPYQWNEDINGNGIIDTTGFKADGTPLDEDLNNDGKLSTITIDWDFLNKYGGYIPNPTWYTIGDSIDVPYYVPDKGRTDVPSHHFIYGGQRTGYYTSDNVTKTLKIDYTNQINNSNQIRTGIETNFYRLHRNNIAIEMSNRTNWRPYIASTQSAGHDEYVRNPMDFAGYVQDKIELKALIMQIGVRYDYFDANDYTFTDPQNPIGSDTLRASIKQQISPRIGISFPITNHGYLHFSYGHFFQMPGFSYLYLNPNLKKAAGVTRFGNPNLNPQKTVMYEFGLQQQLTPTIAVQATLFYRDILNWLSSQYNFLQNGFRYTKYVTQDYGNVRGFTLSLTQRSGPGFSFNVDYTYQLAEGNASSADAQYYDNLQIPPIESEKRVVPLNWDVRHSLNATVSLNTKNGLGFNVINQFSTGRPYTPTIQGQRDAQENSGRIPFHYTTDLKAYKQFQFGSTAFTVSLKIYNLFDYLNEDNVFTGTGRAVYSLVPTYSGDPSQEHGDVPGVHSLNDYLYSPTNYGNPRQILLAVSWDFNIGN